MSKKDYDWKHILKEQEESGVSIKAYCRQHSIHPATFHYHKKRIANIQEDTLFLPVTVEAPSTSDLLTIRINHTLVEVPSYLLPTIIQQLK